MQTFQRGQLVQFYDGGNWQDGVYLGPNQGKSSQQQYPHWCANQDREGTWELDYHGDDKVRPVPNTTVHLPCDDKAVVWGIASRHLDKPSVLSAVATLINTLTRACRTTN